MAGRTGRAAAGRDTDAVTSTTAVAAARRGADRPTDDRASSTSAAAATTPATATAVEPSTTPTAPDRRLPPPSPRTDVAVSVATAVEAFRTGSASQTVGYVQHVLRARGFDPGSATGVADHATRVAFARFQESIGEEPTGLPTGRSLDHLGFDVIG